MVLMVSVESSYSSEEQDILLGIAAGSISHGLHSGGALPVEMDSYNENLRAQRACFVTLEINKQLRGCIGSLLARQALVCDVASNAYAAAFDDPRFAALSARELDLLDIHISILSPPEPMTFSSQDDLISKIKPGIDGLILSDGIYRGTFLPSVWGSLATPELFLSQLKLKAGLPSNYWSDSVKIERYSTFAFGKLISQIHFEHS